MAIADVFRKSAKNDPFYSFNRFQQDKKKDMTKTPAIGGASGYLEDNQDAAYTRYLSSIGIGQADTNPFADWLRKQYGQTQAGYKAALAEDPTLLYQEYLKRLGFNQMYNQFMRLAPNQRGENQSRFVGPVRTIADI